MRIYKLITAKRETVDKIRAGKKTSITFSIKAKTPRRIRLGGKTWIEAQEDQEKVLVQVIEKHRLKNKLLQDGLTDHLILIFKLEENK